MKKNSFRQMVAIRVDISKEIGTGHFMRCLTVADELSKYGVTSVFFCRSLDTSYQNVLVEKGHHLFRLTENCSSEIDVLESGPGFISHVDWLAVSQKDDAEECIRQLKG